MRQKLFIFLLLAIFLFAQVSIVDAKGLSGGSRSSSSSHSFSSKSKGYTGSSSSSKSPGSSKSLGGSSKSSAASSGSAKSSSGSASKGYSGSSGSSSSSRSVPGSYSSSSNTKTNTQKNSYMQDTYKKQASTNNYKAYQQKLTADQKKVYDTSINKNYTVNNRMSFEDAMSSRPQRIIVFNSRPTRIHVNTIYFGGPLSYGSAFVGPWDLWFLLRASDLFWYNHWNDMYTYRNYFDAADFAARERAVSQMQAQNIARNDAYLDPDVDPDLQFSNDYEQGHLNNIYYTNRNASSGRGWVATLIVILIIIIVLVFILRAVSRRRKKPTFQSRIY